MEPTLEGDLARVTETVELVQLAKNAGVSRGAINTCFDKGKIWVQHNLTPLSNVLSLEMLISAV